MTRLLGLMGSATLFAFAACADTSGDTRSAAATTLPPLPSPAFSPSEAVSPTSTAVVAASFSASPTQTEAITTSPLATPVVQPTSAPTQRTVTVPPTPVQTQTPATTAPAPTATPVSRPRVIDVQGATMSVFATFDRPMLQTGGAGAVTVVANYQFDGQPLPAGSTILCNTPQCTALRIELPTLLTPGSAHTLRLANLVSQGGALLDPNPTVRTFQTFRP